MANQCSRAGIAAALLLLSGAGVMSSDAAQAPGPGTTLALTISTATANPAVPFDQFDGEPTKVFDFDGDGQLEIVAQNNNGHVYVFDSRTGAVLADLKTWFPPLWDARSINGPEATVLRAGGPPHLVLANSAGVITDYRFDGRAADASFLFTEAWHHRLDDCFANPGMDSKPVFADLDGDGTLEVLGFTEEFGAYALYADGALYWKNCLGGGNAEPTVADVDQDGKPDVVVVSDGGVVALLNGQTGDWKWGYSVLDHFDLGSASMPVGAAVGQLDGVGPLDIVVGVRDSHDATDWTNDSAMLLALSGNGTLLWASQDPDGNPLTYTHVILRDVDGDGALDVFWADWNTVGHKPPWEEANAWNRTGPAHFYRFDHRGSLVWTQALDTFWNNKDLAFADVNGDGVPEVLVNGPSPGVSGDGVWYLDVATGAKRSFVDTSPWKLTRGAIVADMWGTGTAQWVVAVEADTAPASGGALLLFDTHAAYRAAPPAPRAPPPAVGPSPPPLERTFDATFQLRDARDFRQGVVVVPRIARTISGVDASFDGGPAQPMTLGPANSWTSASPAPAGGSIVFTATDSSGNTATSPVFVRQAHPAPAAPPPAPPAAALSARPPDPPSAGDGASIGVAAAVVAGLAGATVLLAQWLRRPS